MDGGKNGKCLCTNLLIFPVNENCFGERIVAVFAEAGDSVRKNTTLLAELSAKQGNDRQNRSHHLAAGKKQQMNTKRV